jgi:hypothetical protein
MPNNIIDSLDKSSVSLHQLFIDLPDHDAITDTLDYILGALYGLYRAHDLGFRNRTGAHFSEYRPHLANYALEIAKHQSVNELWSAGFYFNSAIQRIAAAFDRIPQMLGATSRTAKERMAEVNPTAFEKWQKVYDEVNAFKHDPNGKVTGRTVSMSDAVTSFDQILQLLISNKLKLGKQ